MKPLLHGGHIVPGDQKSFVLPRQTSPPMVSTASVSKRVLVHNHSNGNELRILMQIKLISLSIVEHQDSLRDRDKQQLGNGLLGAGQFVGFCCSSQRTQ